MFEPANLFAPPGHFYSPVPSFDEAEFAIYQHNQEHNSELIGLDIDLDKMEGVWNSFQPSMSRAPFPKDRSKRFRFFYNNPFFSYGDALVYYAMLDLHRPKSVIEIGSGYSSALLLDSIDDLKLQTSAAFIEPYPTQLYECLRPADLKTTNVVVSKIQGVEASFYDRLVSGDFLFIDSSHVAKTGSDLTVELFQILPRLKPGVFVHFHDIFAGFEYPKDWVMTENRGWNECYFLRAFLMYNRSFEIVFFNSHFAAHRPSLVADSESDFKQNVGGSLWLRKTDL